jgi:nucleotidyltransferase substrate binding protein (TIGR01987 family)
MEALRWKQRLEHFQNSFQFLSESLTEKGGNRRVINAGIIKAYEMCFELAWKTLKDFLEFKGFKNISNPRDILKEAFQAGFLDDGHIWIKMLEERNTLVHSYDADFAETSATKIRGEFFPQIHHLINFFKAQ